MTEIRIDPLLVAKHADEAIPRLAQLVKAVVERHMAGDHMDESIIEAVRNSVALLMKCTAEDSDGKSEG